MDNPLPKNLQRCDSELANRLRMLAEKDVQRELGDYATKGEIRALLARRDLILEHFEKLAAKRGEAAVYYEFLPSLEGNEPEGEGR